MNSAIIHHIVTVTDAKPTGHDKYSGHCRAHGSKRHRDLSVKVTPSRILLHCFAGCELSAICAHLGLHPRDLFLDARNSNHRGQRPAPTPPRVDRRALAFRYELGALDLRLRAERIVQTAIGIDVSALDDADLDKALTAVASAYADCERATLFEHTADRLMERHYAERRGGR
jgi:hypothetical protein